MTDELEWRLHALLSERAEQLDPSLTGPQLRARAVEQPTGHGHRPRRIAAMLAAAAAVAGLALAAANFDEDSGGRRPVGPVPGGQVHSPPQRDRASSAPSPSVTPSPSTTPGPSATTLDPSASTRARPRPPVVSTGSLTPPVRVISLPPTSSTSRVGVVVVPAPGRTSTRPAVSTFPTSSTAAAGRFAR